MRNVRWSQLGTPEAPTVITRKSTFEESLSSGWKLYEEKWGKKFIQDARRRCIINAIAVLKAVVSVTTLVDYLATGKRNFRAAFIPTAHEMAF